MPARRRRPELEEEHNNHERWMVTYADMITLLMVLFIVMFAMSQVDQKKFDQLKEGLAAGFGTDSPAVLEGARSVLPDDGDAAVQAISPSLGRPSLTPQQSAQVDRVVRSEAQATQSRRYAEAQAEADRLEAVLRRLQDALRRHGLLDDVQVRIDQRGLVVSLVSRHVVFDYDRAGLTDRGRRVVDVLAPVLRELPDHLEIDGHTNQEKVKPRYYPTDWELSAARAATVLRRLAEHGRIPGDRLTLEAFGHERPLVDPAKPGSQQVNKRVDIVVRTSLPEETRALLGSVAAGRKASR